MALTLTIGVPAKAQGANNPPSFIEFVDFASIVIQNSVQVAADTMEFTLLITANAIDPPESGNEVIFKDGSTIEFGGVLTSLVRKPGPEPSTTMYECSCRDYVYFLNRRLVNKTISSQAAGVTIKEILTHLFDESDSDIHYEFFKDNVGNIVDGNTLAKFTFDRIIPSQAFDMIAQSTGMQWWIDFDKKVYFKLLNASSTSHLDEVSLDIDNDITTYFDYEEEETVENIATQIILRDMTLQSTADLTDTFKMSQQDVDAGKKIFSLSRTPFGFSGVTSVTLDTGGGDTSQTLKFEDIDGKPEDGTGGSSDVFIRVKEPSGSYVRFSDSNTLSLGDVIKVNYKYAITDDLEDPDFAAVDEMARRTGGDGIHQFIYHQTSGMRFTNLDDAEHVVEILRIRKARILRRGSFSSWVKGWQAGQTYVRKWGSVIDNEAMFVIAVTKTVLTPDTSNNLADTILQSNIIFANIPYGISF